MHLEQSICAHCAQLLTQTLADTYILYLKTQNFHWNVKDPRFSDLHLFFEKQYQELAEAVDVIAERIRILKFRAPASMQEFLEITSLEESIGDVSADEMIQILLNDNESIAQKIRPLIPESQKKGDEGTADLLIERLRAHEKAAWMLRSHFTNADNA